MNESFTDCRTDVGITVNLVDSLIAISRVLADRNLNYIEVKEALKDLQSTEELKYLLQIYTP